MHTLHHRNSATIANLPTTSTALDLIFREATSRDDLLQICALNHRTFAEELGQHPVVPSGLLIDRFHDRNRYFVAAWRDEVVGMISAHSGPEFSVARKLKNSEVLQEFPNPLEVRLLAIARHVRNRTLLAGLFWMVYEYAVARRYSHLLISGVVDREPMYRKLGFQALGPAVQEGSASFIPMVMEIGGGSINPPKRAISFERHWSRIHAQHKPPILLLPGPVNIDPDVERGFKQELISHRSESFISMFEETRTSLRSLAPGLDVAVFPGSGTLANDAVAANLRALFGDSAGLIISNGEFGERLVAQANRAGMVFQHLQFNWGEAWDWSRLRNSLDGSPGWIWTVHLETSTGVLNDVATLIHLASRCGALVALDCVSSLGAVPMPAVNNTLHFMTSVSGKSIGSYAGLGIVYLSEEVKRLLRHITLCTSFDLVRMAEMRGPSTTVPSPMLLALRAALRQHHTFEDQRLARFRSYEMLGKTMRQELRAAGLPPLCREEIAAPTITTFRLPDQHLPSDCLRAGYRIAHESPYLQARGWGQIATMGNVTRNDLEGLITLLRSRSRP
ncbi:MAG TPA: aminotransferase class V-fold PLP-dependent enzyme [Acidobacteriaceae bacterium]|nr:aminotransferase class V-fold PLP-dependent enzyme [Acidobacteriaceae bacterium]